MAGKNVSGELTDLQAAFVAEYVRNGGNGTAAARAAGYSVPNQRAAKLLRVPAVCEAIRAETFALVERHAPAAVLALVSQLDDPSVKPADKRKAAEAILDRGYLAKTNRHEVTHEVGASVGDLIRQVAEDRKARIAAQSASFPGQREADISQLIDITPQTPDAS